MSNENRPPKRKLSNDRVTRSKVQKQDQLVASADVQSSQRSSRRLQSGVLTTPVKLIPELVKPTKSSVKKSIKSLDKVPLSEEEKQKLMKNVFSTNFQPDKLIGREKQQAQIEAFLQENVKAARCKSMYVSGAAGIGKTATIDQCLQKLTRKCTVLKVNCMAGNVWQSILAQVDSEDLTGSPVDKVEQLFQDKDQFFILMLDEVDHITQQEVLYRIFEWPSKSKFRVLIIGIANTIDLTQRLLPRLQARDCQPMHVIYGAYTAEEVSLILKDRVQYIQRQFESPELIFHPAAIDLAARKVASFGDFRKALDLCRYALDLKTGSTVSVMDMVRAIDRSFGVVNTVQSKMDKFTVHQKSILVTVVLMMRQELSSEVVNVEPTMLRVYEVYSQLCRNGNFGSQLSRSEFVDILTSIETSGVVQAAKRVLQTPKKAIQSTGYFTPGNRKRKTVIKTPTTAKITMLNPDSKVRLCVTEDEVMKSVSEVPNLKALMDDGLPDVVLAKLK